MSQRKEELFGYFAVHFQEEESNLGILRSTLVSLSHLFPRDRKEVAWVFRSETFNIRKTTCNVLALTLRMKNTSVLMYSYGRVFSFEAKTVTKSKIDRSGETDRIDHC